MISIDKFNKRTIMLLLSLVGALLSLYIYYADTYSTGVICPNNGCAIVANSEYSRIFGIPVSILGFLYYVGLVLLIVLKDIFKKYLNILLGLGIGWGVLFTIYLRFLEFFYIKAICIWCWGSVIIVALLTVTYFLFLIDEKSFRN